MQACSLIGDPLGTPRFIMTLILIGDIIRVTTVITAVIMVVTTVITITTTDLTTTIITETDVVLFAADATFTLDTIPETLWHLVVTEPVEFPVVAYLQTEPVEPYVILVPVESIEPVVQQEA